jgi:hypothetical protein
MHTIGEKSVKDLNIQVGKCLLHMAPRPAEMELVRVYENRFLWELAMHLKARTPPTLEAGVALIKE